MKSQGANNKVAINELWEKSPHQHRVDRFRRLAGQFAPICVNPRPSDAALQQQLNIILEEFLEFVEAAGYKLVSDEEGLRVVKNYGQPFSLPDFVDGAGDLEYVSIGALSLVGVPDIAILEMIDHNNLQKFGPGSSIAPDGKLIKPPDHRPPDIVGYLKSKGWDPDE